MKQSSKNVFYILSLSLISFSINFYSANKGVLPIDTFLHYDTSFNILKGNIPIRDFWIVHGLTLDYFQVIFFKIFGVNWLSYIIHSSFFNVLITISTFKFFLLFNIKKLYAFFLALSFAIMAYPISGTLFLDQHAIFFCLLSYYLFFFGIKKDTRYYYFIPIFFTLAFFSKPVPSSYFIIIFGLIFIYQFYTKKDFDLFKKLLWGSSFSIIVLFLFIMAQKIDFDMFLTQLFYYPSSIGQDRLLALDINLKKIVSNYKFIILPLLLSFILFFYQKENKSKKEILFVFIVFFLFNLFSIYHQLLTKNQNFIFFLIPLNLGFLILFLKNSNLKKARIINMTILLFIFCVFTTAKYFERFIIQKKFHDFQNVNLSNTIPAEGIHESLNPLKWKTYNYDQPIDEINLIREVLVAIENEKEPVLLMTNHNFISSISKKRIIMLSRTYDDISFPNRKNIHYKKFKNFFSNKLKNNNISNIYLVFDKNYLDTSANRYIYEYFDKDCFRKKKINEISLKFNFNNCRDNK